MAAHPHLTPEVVSHSGSQSWLTEDDFADIPDPTRNPRQAGRAVVWLLQGVMVSHSCFLSEEKTKHVEIERNPSSSSVEAIVA